MAEATAETSWRDVFSRRGPNIYRVRDEYWELIDDDPVHQLAAHEGTEQRLMAGDSHTLVFLDGGVVFVNHEWPDMFDNDLLSDGIWVVGTLALRAVCDAVGLRPPARLKGESVRPSLQSIRRAVSIGETVAPPKQQSDLIQCRSGAEQLLDMARSD